MSGPGKEKLPGLIQTATVVGIIGFFYLAVALISQRRVFDPDEFLHLHSSWSSYHGLVPYRDFFDHYTPLFHLIFVPFFRFFRVETDIADAFAFLFFARKLSWLISGVVLASTFWLGKLWRNTAVGLAAVLFLITTEAYWNYTLEVRPDAMASAFFLLCLITVVRAVQGTHSESIRRAMFACSGLFLAFGFLTIQKSVYGFPGFAAGMCWYMFKPSDRGTLRSRIADVAFQFTGFCVPMILTAAYFYAQNGLTQFIRYNFLFFLGAAKESPIPPLHQLLYQHPFLGFLGAAGLVCSLATIFRRGLPWQGDFIIAPATLSLLVGLFLIPFPYYQYYIAFLPLVAVFAAGFLMQAVDWLSARRSQLTQSQWIVLAAGSCIVILAGILFIAWDAGSQRPLVLIMGFWAGLLIACMALVFLRTPDLALALFFVGIVAVPSLRLKTTWAAPGLTAQFEEIRYIMENTSPTETVMDGYRGTGVFRPHAYFYWFLTFNDRSRISPPEREQALQDLHSGVIAPKLILYDINLQNVSPGITEFLENNYVPVGRGVIRRRK